MITKGIVEDAGGGVVEVLVDRDTTEYPPDGTRVSIKCVKVNLEETEVKQPTRKQRLHFIWLVVENAYQLMRNCKSREEMTTMIRQATKKRTKLGLPWIEDLTDRERTLQLGRRMNEFVPSVHDYANVQEDQYDPFE